MDDYVSFEIAKKLKENGFDEYSDRSYTKVGLFNDTETYKSSKEFYCYAPTISQVLKWLRKEKGLHIAIDIWGRTWGYDIVELTSGNSLHWTSYREDIKSYENAALDGIKYILDNLI